MDDLLLICAILLAERRDRVEQSSDDESNSNSLGQLCPQESSSQGSQPKALARQKIYPKTKSVLVAKGSKIAGTALKRFSSPNSSTPETKFAKIIKTATPSSSDSVFDFCNYDPDDDVTLKIPDNERSRKDFKVDIAHKNYPEIKLNDEQIAMIKTSLLDEIDETEDLAASIGFISSVSEDGRLALTCQNTETRDWLMCVISKLNVTLNMDIKAISDNIICTLHILPEDIMAPNALKHRLAKQNLGLLTTEWRFLKSAKNEKGGETVTYCIDEKSKQCIEARGGQLFLNFSQTSVKIN